jgi:metallophosphoesterase superfamily enzyme
LAARGVALVALAGNHDATRVCGRPETLEVAGWTIGHGHRPLASPKTITGHLHPALRTGRLTAPCFLVGPARIVLPAFSPNAAGVSVISGAFVAVGRDRSLRCVAGAGERLLDFGPLHELQDTLRRRSSDAAAPRL